MFNLCLGRRSALKHIPQEVAPPLVKKFPVSLRDAYASDVGALARVHVAAFREDRYVRLMYNECSHWKAINAMLESRYAKTDYIFQVALTGEMDRIAGWICCGVVGDPEAPVRNGLAHHAWVTALAQVVGALQEYLTRTSGDREDRAQCQQRQDLWKVVSQNSTDAQISIMGDRKYLVINTLVTDPCFAGHGVGSELLTCTSLLRSSFIPLCTVY